MNEKGKYMVSENFVPSYLVLQTRCIGKHELFLSLLLQPYVCMYVCMYDCQSRTQSLLTVHARRKRRALKRTGSNIPQIADLVSCIAFQITNQDHLRIGHFQSLRFRWACMYVCTHVCLSVCLCWRQTGCIGKSELFLSTLLRPFALIRQRKEKQTQYCQWMNEWMNEWMNQAINTWRLARLSVTHAPWYAAMSAY